MELEKAEIITIKDDDKIIAYFKIMPGIVVQADSIDKVPTKLGEAFKSLAELQLKTVK